MLYNFTAFSYLLWILKALGCVKKARDGRRRPPLAGEPWIGGFFFVNKWREDDDESNQGFWLVNSKNWRAWIIIKTHKVNGVRGCTSMTWNSTRGGGSAEVPPTSTGGRGRVYRSTTWNCLHDSHCNRFSFSVLDFLECWAATFFVLLPLPWKYSRIGIISTCSVVGSSNTSSSGKEYDLNVRRINYLKTAECSSFLLANV